MKSIMLAALVLLATNADAYKSSSSFKSSFGGSKSYSSKSYSSSKSKPLFSSSSNSSSSYKSNSYKTTPVKPLFSSTSSSTPAPKFSSSKPVSRPASPSYSSTPKPSFQSSQGAYKPKFSSSAGARPYTPVRYNSYNRPITRSPNWYHSGYNYNFRNSQYNRGYNYYPVNVRSSGTDLLTGALAGALVTYMIMDDGREVPVYANGDGTAYVNNGQGNVQLVQDANGNWVQLDPINQTQVQQNYNPPPQKVIVNNPPVKDEGGLGFWGWTLIILGVGIVGFFGWKLWYTGKLWY